MESTFLHARTVAAAVATAVLPNAAGGLHSGQTMRPLAAMLVVLFASLAPNLAQAEECTCVLATLELSADEGRIEAFFDGGLAQSVEVGPFFSSDGAALVSDEPALEGVAGREAQQAPRRTILLCLSADDPSCSGRDEAPAPDQMPQLVRQSGWVRALTFPRFRDGGRLAIDRSVDQPGPRGSLQRIERPPRA